jgi:hypothetical protein
MDWGSKPVLEVFTQFPLPPNANEQALLVWLQSTV